MCTLTHARLLTLIGAETRRLEGNYGHPALMLGARVDKATDFVGVEEDPFQ